MVDPVAVFRHDDLSRECISERSWQRLSVDRVSACQFDSTGRFAAIYSNWCAVELWDFSSQPVIQTSLLLPKHLANRFDGVCQALAWSPCGTYVAGTFGHKSQQLKRKIQATGEIEPPVTSEMFRDTYFIQWDIHERRIVHQYRLPFPVCNMISTQLERPISELLVGDLRFVLGCSNSSSVFLLNTTGATGQIRLVPATGGGSNGSTEAWTLTDLAGAASTGSTASEPAQIGNSHNAEGGSFAQWWSAHQHSCSASTSTPSVVTAHGNTLYIASHSAVESNSNREGAATVGNTATSIHAAACTVHVVRLYKQQEPQVLHSVVVSAAGRAVALNLDAHHSLLTVTMDNSATTVFRAPATGTLVPIAEHWPSDRSTIELLNSQHSAGIHVRSAAKYHASATRKLNSVAYGASTTFRCTYAGLYGEFAPHEVNNTRFTNSLRPYDLLPVENAPADEQGASLSQKAVKRVTSSAVVADSETAVHAEEYQTSVIYCVQSSQRAVHGQGVASGSGSLIMWTFDTAAKSESEAASVNGSSSAHSVHSARSSATTARPGQLRVVALPTHDVAQIAIAPCTLTAATQGRRPPRQAVLCVDGNGGLHHLRASYHTDFPGPMYPLGYALITKVITYLEREDELDIPAGKTTAVPTASRGNSASSLKLSRNNSNSSASGASSTDSLLGLGLLLDEVDPVKQEPAGSNSHAAAKSNAARHSAIPGVSISHLVCGGDTSTRRRPSGSGLPFTFANDWLCFPVRTQSASNLAGAAGGSATQSGTGEGVLSPIPPHRRDSSAATGTADAGDAMDVEADDAHATRTNTERESSVPNDAFTAGFETYLPVPLKLQNGDFDTKLQRQRAAAETLRRTILEPQRVGEKLKQVQEEAVAAAYRAAEMREKKRVAALERKEQKERARAEAAAKKAAELAEQQRMELVRLQEERRILAAVDVRTHTAEGRGPIGASGNGAPYTMGAPVK